MLTETGRVVAVNAHAVWVETLRQSTCGSCAARAGCGHGMLNTARPGAAKGVVKVDLPLDASLAVNLHDTVEIAVPESSFLRAAGLLYAMPLLMTVAGAVLADQFWVSAAMTQGAEDLRVTFAAALGMTVGLTLLRLLSRRIESEGGIHPRVTAVT